MPFYTYELEDGTRVDLMKSIKDRDSVVRHNGMTAKRIVVPTRMSVVVPGHFPNPESGNYQARKFMHAEEEKNPNWYKQTGFSKKELDKAWPKQYN